MPKGSETAFTFSSSTQPLEALKNDLIMFNGLHFLEDSGSRPHPCNSTLFTNVKEGSSSIDQIVSDQVGAGARFPYLHFGLADWRAQMPAWWRGKQGLPTEVNAARAFEKVFAGRLPKGGVTDQAAEARVALRKSVIDYVNADLVALAQRVGSADKRKIEAHLDAIRKSEHLVAKFVGGSCSSPGAPGADIETACGDSNGACLDKNYSARRELMADIIASALACDLTRVVAFNFVPHGSRLVARDLLGGVYSRDHHSLSHGDGAPKSSVNKLDQLFAKEVAGFVQTIKDKSEGGTSLLDHTVALWGNEFGAWTSSQHWRKDIPFVVFGGKWAWKTGRYVNGGGKGHGRLLTSVVQAMGVDVDMVGNKAFGVGGLPGL
jgi:hypothetical protein